MKKNKKIVFLPKSSPKKIRKNELLKNCKSEGSKTSVPYVKENQLEKTSKENDKIY